MSEGWDEVRETVAAVIAERPESYDAEIQTVMADVLSLMQTLDLARP